MERGNRREDWSLCEILPDTSPHHPLSSQTSLTVLQPGQATGNGKNSLFMQKYILYSTNIMTPIVKLSTKEISHFFHQILEIPQLLLSRVNAIFFPYPCFLLCSYWDKELLKCSVGLPQTMLFAIRGLCLKHAELSSQILHRQHCRARIPDTGSDL